MRRLNVLRSQPRCPKKIPRVKRILPPPTPTDRLCGLRTVCMIFSGCASGSRLENSRRQNRDHRSNDVCSLNIVAITSALLYLSATSTYRVAALARFHLNRSRYVHQNGHKPPAPSPHPIYCAVGTLLAAPIPVPPSPPRCVHHPSSPEPLCRFLKTTM